uniref:G-protein coupled receptors family 1 profile domain-containing protein n=1 Tax=Clytia hemisphaerica TaxID=252671 RepID=A0A7M5XD64_9CNID
IFGRKVCDQCQWRPNIFFFLKMKCNNSQNWVMTPAMKNLLGIETSISIVVAILNIIEIVLIKRKKEKTNFDRLLMSLSMADLLYGALNGLLNALRIIQSNSDILFNVRLFFMLASTLHLLLIGTDRLVAVAKPLKHRVIATPKRIYWSIFLVWVLSISGLAIFQFFYQSSQNSPKTNSTDPLHSQQKLEQGVQKVESQIKSSIPFSNNTSTLSRLPNKTLQSNSTALWCNNNSMAVEIQIRSVDMYNKEKILAYCIIGAAVSLTILYSLVIYYVQRSQVVEIRRKVSLISILVPACFILFTIPYAVYSLLTQAKVDLSLNVVMLLNSGVNSVLYFFKNKFQTCTGVRSMSHVHVKRRTLSKTASSSLTTKEQLQDSGV